MKPIVKTVKRRLQVYLKTDCKCVQEHKEGATQNLIQERPHKSEKAATKICRHYCPCPTDKNTKGHNAIVEINKEVGDIEMRGGTTVIEFYRYGYKEKENAIACRNAYHKSV